MVDPIGFKPATSVERRGVTRVTAGAQGAATPSPRDAETQATSNASIAAAARTMAAAPPVDTERVAKIRRAIAEGRFPITPATIADRLIALKMNWDPNE